MWNPKPSILVNSLNCENDEMKYLELNGDTENDKSKEQSVKFGRIIDCTILLIFKIEI